MEISDGYAKDIGGLKNSRRSRGELDFEQKRGGGGIEGGITGVEEEEEEAEKETEEHEDEDEDDAEGER